MPGSPSNAVPNQLTPEEQQALNQWQHETEQQLVEALRLPRHVLGFALVTGLLVFGSFFPTVIW